MHIAGSPPSWPARHARIANRGEAIARPFSTDFVGKLVDNLRIRQVTH
jgi:hypothetical protein